MQRRTKVIIAACAAFMLVGLIISVVGVAGLLLKGVSSKPDNIFGDQHLKTTVAVLELHKVRYGRYPDTLAAIPFMGEWDKAVISSVQYIPSADRQHYFIEVERGWVGKPSLNYPDEFWRGTGYDPNLNPPQP